MAKFIIVNKTNQEVIEDLVVFSLLLSLYCAKCTVIKLKKRYIQLQKFSVSAAV